MEIWPRILTIVAAGEPCVLVTVLADRGSVPRAAGARMIVRADGGFHGTIGGGALEWQALARAQALMHRGGARAFVMSQSLGPGLGQCCGGHVTLGLELFDACDRETVADLARAEAAGPFTCLTETTGEPFRRQVLPPGSATGAPAPRTYRESFGRDLPVVAVFGAGHVGRAIVIALAPLPFRVVWSDRRPGAFPDAVPANATPIRDAPSAVLRTVPDGAQVLVLTHSHAEDLAIVAEALASGRFAHVGVIGSQTKRARFLRRLADLGLGEAAARLRCPIGLPGLADKDPAVIAASVAAECLILRDSRSINAESAACRQNA